MQELIGKKLRHKQEPFSNGKRVDRIEGDTVYFEDNGRAPLSVIREMFEEVGNNGNNGNNIPNNTNPVYKQVDTQSVMNTNQNPIVENNNSNNSNINTDNDIIDPSNFFTSNSPTLSDLANQIKGINTGQTTNQSGNYISQAQPAQEITTDGEFPEDGEIVFNPNAQKVKQQLSQNSNQVQNKPLAPQNDPNVLAQFDNRVDDGGAVRKVDNDKIKRQLEQVQNGMTKEQTDYINAPLHQQSSNTPSFPKMKKNTKIVLNLKIEEIIPKPESIKNLNDLFEESIIDILAREMTQDFLKDPKKLEDMIVEELERIVYKKKKVVKKSPTKTVKPTKKKTVVKKTE